MTSQGADLPRPVVPWNACRTPTATSPGRSTVPPKLPTRRTGSSERRRRERGRPDPELPLAVTAGLVDHPSHGEVGRAMPSEGPSPRTKRNSSTPEAAAVSMSRPNRGEHTAYRGDGLDPMQERSRGARPDRCGDVLLAIGVRIGAREFVIDDASSVPPFEQLRDQVIDAVAAGEPVPGSKLPTVRALTGSSFGDGQPDGHLRVQRAGPCLGTLVAFLCSVVVEPVQIELVVAETRLG